MGNGYEHTQRIDRMGEAYVATTACSGRCYARRDCRSRQPPCGSDGTQPLHRPDDPDRREQGSEILPRERAQEAAKPLTPSPRLRDLGGHRGHRPVTPEARARR